LVWNCYIVLEDIPEKELLSFGIRPFGEKVHWIQKMNSHSFSWNIREVSDDLQYIHSSECECKLSPETVFYQQQQKLLNKMTIEDLKDLASEYDISTVHSTSGKSLKKQELINILIPFRFLRIFF
jgi:hypothetical protein